MAQTPQRATAQSTRLASQRLGFLRVLLLFVLGLVFTVGFVMFVNAKDAGDDPKITWSLVIMFGSAVLAVGVQLVLSALCVMLDALGDLLEGERAAR